MARLQGFFGLILYFLDLPNLQRTCVDLSWFWGVSSNSTLGARFWKENWNAWLHCVLFDWSDDGSTGLTHVLHLKPEEKVHSTFYMMCRLSASIPRGAASLLLCCGNRKEWERLFPGHISIWIFLLVNSTYACLYGADPAVFLLAISFSVTQNWDFLESSRAFSSSSQ